MPIPILVLSVSILVIVVFCLVELIECQVDEEYSSFNFSNPALLALFTQAVYGRISNLTTTIFTGDIRDRSSFCIKNAEADWNQAFNFSSNLDFLSSCILKTKGDISRRLCSAADVKFYFSNFFDKKSGNANYLKPNKNCNLTSWESGCEPGWACSTNQEVDLKDSQNMPGRTRDCQACCEGFFCPRGITCMIRKYKNIQDPLNGLCLVHGNLFNMLAFCYYNQVLMLLQIFLKPRIQLKSSC